MSVIDCIFDNIWLRTQGLIFQYPSAISDRIHISSNFVYLDPLRFFLLIFF